MALDVHVFQFFLRTEVRTDEILALDGVVAHVKLHDLGDALFVREFDVVHPHALTNEIGEFVGRDLSEAFEAGDFHTRLQLGDGFFLLSLVVAVDIVLLVAHPEEGSLEDMDMATADEVRIVLHEEGQHEHADVTITRDVRPIENETGNIYESIVVLSRRSNQISVEIKEELQKKLEEFASYTDNLEEVFENREQIEISKFYEALPKPTAMAIDEFVNDKVYWRKPEKELE